MERVAARMGWPGARSVCPSHMEARPLLQTDLAQQIGTDPSQLYTDLLESDDVTLAF